MKQKILTKLFGEIAQPVESHYLTTIPKPSSKEELEGLNNFFINLKEKRNEIYDILHS